MANGLLKTGISGMAWTSVSVVVRSVVSLLQITILTRYLEKSEFGIVAIATVFIGFTQLFLDLGISIGIMHKQDTTPKVYSSLFWLNIFTGTLLTAILCLASPLAARAYNEPSLTSVLILLSFCVFFSAIGAQHRTVQQKEMRFQYISIVEIISSILTFGVAVYTASQGYGVYSLVYSTLFNAVFSNLVFLGIGLYKDRNISFHFNIKETYPFLKIGVYNIGSNVLDYFSREIDTIIISATFGMEILGVYNLCKKIVVMLYGIVNQILVKVMTPIFAKLQKGADVMRGALYNVMEGIALFNYPLYFLVAILATGCLNILYGNQYTDCGLLLSLLAIYYGKMSSGSASGCVQVAMGRTDVGFYWTIIRIIVNTMAVCIGSLISIEMVVASLFIFNLLISPVSWRIVTKPLVSGRFLDYFLIPFKPFCYTFVIALPFYLLWGQTIQIGQMIICAIVFLLVYSAMIWFFYRQSFFVQSLLMPVVKNIKEYLVKNC
jgi:teichuronic acid exporter